MQENLRKKALSSFIWGGLQRTVGQLISFVVTIVLTRLLLPSDYGVVALAGMFNVLIGIFISGGMNAALIQKEDTDELDYNTVFYFSLFMSFVIYGVVYIGAPFVVDIYVNPLITPIMRVSVLGMPIGSLGMVKNAVVSR